MIIKQAKNSMQQPNSFSPNPKPKWEKNVHGTSVVTRIGNVVQSWNMRHKEATGCHFSRRSNDYEFSSPEDEQRFLLNLCAKEEIILSHLSFNNICVLKPIRKNYIALMARWIVGATVLHQKNLADLWQNLEFWGMTTINALMDLTLDRQLWAARAVKILTAGGIAAVGADTRQGLLVTSSFLGHLKLPSQW